MSTLVYIKMFKWLNVLTIGIILFGASISYKSYKNYKVYLVRVQNVKDMNLLRSFASNVSGIDFWDSTHRIKNGECRIMVNPDMVKSFLEILNLNNIEHNVAIDDFQKVIDDEKKINSRSLKFSRAANRGPITKHRTLNVYFEHFWTYDEVIDYLDALKDAFNDHVEVTTIGMTEERRKLQTIRIFGENLSARPKTIIIDATMHAREWISTMMAIYIIYELVEKRESNLDLLNDKNWVILPIVNPDGYVYSHTTDRLWRKTRTKLENSGCVGIDPNRNFDYHWNTKKGSSKNPCAENYRGPSPSSTPEVVSLTTLLNQYSNTKLYLTFHSYGAYIMYPYGYTVRMIKDFKILENLAKRVRKAIEKNTKSLDKSSVYKVGNSAFLMYIASGGSDDYAAGVANIPFVYTLELPGGGRYGFDCSASDIIPIVSSTFKGVKIFGNYFNSH